jgi:hypothetical protein
VKVAIVKQLLDVFGPWSGMKWTDTSPMKLFDVWPGKALYWELTCMLQADWYIVPVSVEGEYLRDAIGKQPGRAEMVRRHTKNVTDVAAIPFEDYDLVLTIDAILEIPPGLPNLFAYYAQEHWDPLYWDSLRQPLNGYDLFLAHMMDAPHQLKSLPQAVAFPYLHDPEVIRPVFSPPRQEISWLDWRTVITLANQPIDSPWSPEADAALHRAEDALGIPLRCGSAKRAKTYFIHDAPSWGDAADYTRALAECRYYIGLGRLAGAGQGLAEAAALGCLCIGQSDRAYHRLLCHPSCLLDDLLLLPATLKRLRESTDFQQEVLAHQDRNLCLHFRDRPLALLAQALDMKRKQP